MNFKECITKNVYRSRVPFNGLTFYDYLMTLSVAKSILQGRMVGGAWGSIVVTALRY